MFKNGRITVEENSIIWQNLQRVFAGENHLHFGSSNGSEQLPTDRDILRTDLQVDQISLINHSDLSFCIFQFTLYCVDFIKQLLKFQLAELAQLILVLNL